MSGWGIHGFPKKWNLGGGGGSGKREGKQEQWWKG